MAEIKTHYNINNLDAREINFVLNQIATRIDALEGLRGEPRFYRDINAGANKITNTVDGNSSGDVLTYPLSSSGQYLLLAGRGGQTINDDLTLGDTASGNYLTIISGTITIYAGGEIVHKIEGGV